MAHVPLPPITPRTGLWGLGFRMEVIASSFYNLYQDIQDVWVIGKWLSWPFYILSLYFNIARDKCWQSDQELVKVITWVTGFVEGNTIADILERIWDEFTFLRYDPIGWVRQKIDQVSGELSFLRNDPYGWVRSRLYGAFPVFYNLLGNSGWWVYSKLDERFPEIGEFIRDTWGFIRSKVLDIFWFVRELDTNPLQFIIDRIQQRAWWFTEFLVTPEERIKKFIRNISWDLWLVMTDPIGWVKGKVGYILGLSSYEMDTFIPSLIRRAFGAVLSNEGGLLDYVSEAMVNLILRFI